MLLRILIKPYFSDEWMFCTNDVFNKQIEKIEDVKRPDTQNPGGYAQSRHAHDVQHTEKHVRGPFVENENATDEIPKTMPSGYASTCLRLL